MANKRVSELAPITPVELAQNDLFLLADVSANESKKLEVGDLASYLIENGLLSGSLSGSLYGTASWALNAVSASWAPSQISCSYAQTSSWAINCLTASLALQAISASYSLSSSYAVTASYAFTSSVQLIFSSAFSDFAKSASYLIYSPINGTASYSMFAFTAGAATSSISSSEATTASFAITSSFLLYAGAPNGTASYAVKSFTSDFAVSASVIIQADSASYVSGSNVDGFVNSSSYALSASAAQSSSYCLSASYSQHPMMSVESSSLTPNFGLTTNTVARFNDFTISPSDNVPKDVILEMWGDLLYPIVTSPSNFPGVNMNTTQSNAPFQVLVWDQSLFISMLTGSISGQNIAGFYLKGIASLTGSYSARATTFNGATFFTSSRPVRMSIRTTSDGIITS